MKSETILLINGSRLIDNLKESYEKSFGPLCDTQDIVVCIPFNTIGLIYRFDDVIKADKFAYNNNGIVLSDDISNHK